MSERRWQRMAEIFQEALELPSEERGLFLDAACGEDRELRRAVSSLLAADREAGDYLEEPLMRISEKF